MCVCLCVCLFFFVVFFGGQEGMIPTLSSFYFSVNLHYMLVVISVQLYSQATQARPVAHCLAVLVLFVNKLPLAFYMYIGLQVCVFQLLLCVVRCSSLPAVCGVKICLTHHR